MPKFCANLGFLFTEHPFLDRFAASAKAGFSAVEYADPYPFPSSQLVGLLNENRLKQILINMPAGDWQAGERGLACLPGRENEFQAGVEQSISYATSLGGCAVNCLAGIVPKGVSQDVIWETLVGNLKFAGKAFQSAGLQLLVEAINPYDMPGFALNTSNQVLRALDDAGVATIKLQYDIYHMQRVEGALSSTLELLLPKIGHIQMASVPGRHEPDQGEINYDHLFSLIDDLGYSGWIGAEYKPVTETLRGLGWLQRYQA
jgi:hydroxypyruvate isomerase